MQKASFLSQLGVRWRQGCRAAVGPLVIDLLERSVARKTWPETQAFARRMARMASPLGRRYKRLALRHINMAFGDELSDEQAREIVEEMVCHVVTFALETLRMATMERDEILAICEINGEEYIKEGLARERGVILCSPHLGNWEVAAVHLICNGYPVAALSRAARSRRIAGKIKSIRDRMGFPVIPISEGTRGLLRTLKQNHLVPIMPDRFARGQGLTVPFFGHNTHMWHTPALLAVRCGCTVLPCSSTRQADGRYRMNIETPLEIPDTGDRDYDVWLATAMLAEHFEQHIRTYPEQYLWPYKLWRPGVAIPPPCSPPEILKS